MTAASQRIVLGILCLFALAGCAKGASTLDDTANGSAGTTGAGTGGATGTGGTGAKTCGNGKIDMVAMEDCDGMLLNNATCQSLGYTGGGTLSCDPTTCKYQLAMCHMKMTAGGAGTGN
jgi:hypothetical protein